MATSEQDDHTSETAKSDQEVDDMMSALARQKEEDKDDEKKSCFMCMKEYFSIGPFVSPIYIFDQIEDDVREYELTYLQRFFMTFEDPNASLIGRVVNVITIATILLSCASFIAASSPAFQYLPESCADPVCDGTCSDLSDQGCVNDKELCDGEKMCLPVPNAEFDVIELICIMIFSVEYVARITTCWTVPARLAGLVPPGWDDAWVEIVLDQDEVDISEEQRRIKKSKLKSKVKKEPLYSWWYQIMKYTWQPFNMVDVGAILPWWLTAFGPSIFGSSEGLLRILRILRVFRVLKLGRRNKSVELLTNTLEASTNVLMLLIFFFVLAVVVFGALLFFLEAGEFMVTENFPDGAFLRQDKLGEDWEESPFTSMITAFYFAVITLATTGYGELVPNSNLGRFFSNICMLTGVLMVALPISVVGSNFTNEYNAVHGDDVDNEQIFTCLLELIDDDDFDPVTLEPVSVQMNKSRKLAAVSAIISCLDVIKHRKLKKELMTFLEDSAKEEPGGDPAYPSPRRKSKTKKAPGEKMKMGPGSSAMKGPTSEEGEETARRERDLKDLAFVLDRLETILHGRDGKALMKRPLPRDEVVQDGNVMFRGIDGPQTHVPSFGANVEMTRPPGNNKTQTQTQAGGMHYLYEESKDITVLNEDREWLDMMAQENGVQHAVQREPLDTVQDLVVRMQTLYMEYDKGEAGGKGMAGRDVWFKNAIDKAEVQALALETAELHLVDLSKISSEDQHTFFLCTYTLLCIHASAACKTNIETIVQTYPSRVGYKIGKRIYTLAEIYDLGGGLERPSA